MQADGVKKVPNSCLVCGAAQDRILGIRGTREYNGANPLAEPHIVTNVVECTQCGFIYTNPAVLGLEYLERNHYNNTEAYTAAYLDDQSEMFGRRVSLIQKHLKTGALLDVGAGKGEFLAEASKAGFQCTGAEPSPNFCEYVTKNFGIEMHCGYLGSIEALKKRKFDVVTMLHVLEHVEHPHELLEEIKSNLNENGLLFIEVPNTDSLFLKIIDSYYKLKGLGWSSRLSPFHAPFHKFGYTPKSLRFLLEKHGFKILDIQTLSGRDRGFGGRSGQKKVELMLRDLAMNAVDALGNRELLCALAVKA